MKLEAQLKLQAHLDGELSSWQARAVARWVARDPEAQDLLARLQAAKNLLAGQELDRPLPVSREFYWAQIERRLTAPVPVRHSWFPAWPIAWPRWDRRWLIPVGTVAASLAILMAWPDPRLARVANLTRVEEVIAGFPQSSYFTFNAQNEGMSVVWIDTSDINP